MKITTLILTMIIVLCAFLTPQDVFAEETNSCHCFKNRVYDPADRFAADEYLLASAFNSLLSKQYGIAKKQIVFLKMKEGASHLDLIVATRVSQLSGYKLRSLLNLRKQKRAWREILFMPEISATSRKDKLINDLLMGKEISTVGAQIADTLVANFYGEAVDSVQQLRRAGMNEKEVTLVMILAKSKKMRPAKLAKQYQAGKSWSQISHELGLSPSQVNELIMAYGR